MKLSNLAMNLRGPWMISPEEAAIATSLLRGVLQGSITEIDHGPEPYRVKCDSIVPAPAGDANPFRDKSIYVTHLRGTMLKYDNCGDPGTRSIGEALLAADADPEIIGHIIVADSGGGSVDSVPEIAEAITGCTKPVVGFVDGIAASACIYALSYCDNIIAHHPQDRVGCIGTLIQLSGYPKFVKESDGYVTARIYADQATEKNADYEAALEGNFQLIKEQTLNPLNEQFITDIRRNRPAVTDDQVTGRTYFAQSVVGTLVDSIGSFGSALQTVMDLAAALLPAGDSASPSQHNMENNYPHLTAIPALNEQVFDEQDGSTVLQPSQLEAVEGALAAAAGLQESADTANRELTEARETIAQRDARITELESSLAAAIERAESAGSPAAGIKPTHSGEGAQGPEPAANFDEALRACDEFLNR